MKYFHLANDYTIEELTGRICPIEEKMQGDKLASGQKSAQFPMPKVSQEEWDERVGKKDGRSSRINS